MQEPLCRPNPQGQGLAHVHEGKTDIFKRADGLSGDDVVDLFEDREGNIWVTTLDGGLDRFRDLSVSTFSSSQGLSNTQVWSVLGARDGGVWLGTTAGLNRWKDGRITIYRKPGGEAAGKIQRPPGVREITDSGLPEDSADSLFEDDAGRTWISTPRGVGYFEHGRFISVAGLPDGAVLSITGGRDDNLWISNRSNGLLHLFQGNVVERIPWGVLGSKDAAWSLIADPLQGGVWLGFTDGHVAYYKDGQIRATYGVADGLGEGWVTSFQIDRDGTLWAATQGGLSRIKNGRVDTITRKNGLPCDTVHWMMDDNVGSAWLLTACGLVRIPQSELDAWTADPKRTISVSVFDSSDGVLSHSTTSGFSPRVAKSTDGRIWFLPFDGVSVIDPRHIPFNSIPPPVHVEQVIADRTIYAVNVDASKRMRLPPLIRDLEIDYTALSLVAAEKVLFRIKLEGFDRGWHDVGNRRQAFYTSLPPGNYRFRVVACNNSGVWNEAGASFDFSILPAFYQTAWFRLLCCAALLLLLWGSYQLRLRQLRLKFAIGLEARVSERTRIARELHDTLLQSLHGVLFQFQAARNLLPRSPAEAMAALDGALLETEQAIAESRDAIHDLRAEPAGASDLAELLTATGQELAESRKTDDRAPEFRLVAEGERRTLSGNIQDEIHWIAHEILRNAFQHARADRIEAEIRYDDREFRLRIRDDGVGIDPKVLQQGGRSGHSGLRGIHERAQEIGAELDFWSEAGAGTEVQLTVPAAGGYDQAANDDRRDRDRRGSLPGGKTT